MPYIGQRPATGEHNSFKILDDISNYTLTFGSSDINVSADTITAREHRFVTGQRVTYGNGGGTTPTGLSNGTVYYIIVEDRHTFKLATSASNAVAGTAINITAAGSGAAHTINVAFDGVNTKFKATHTNGTKADISQSGQLMVSVNGVLQQPHDNTTTPTTGYATDHTSTIIFSAAPAAGDQFFGRLIASNFATFDISDNTVDNFTGDGSTSTFTLSKTPPNNESILVTIDGVVQYPDDNAAVRAYTVSENVLDFASAPGNGVEIQVRHIGFAGASTAAVSGFYGRTGNAVLKNTDDIVFRNANVGVVTATDIRVTGNLTVDGTTTTLDTDLIGVDKLEVSANNTTVAAAITQTGSGDILNLYDGGTEVFSVTDGGKVKIGTTTEGEVTADNLTIADSGHCGVTIRSGTSSEGNIFFSDGTSGDSEYRGMVRYEHSNDAMVFKTATAERLRITSTGNVGINETSPASTLVVRKDNQGGRGGELSIVNYAGGGSNGIGNEAALNFGLENSTYDADDGNAQIKAVTTAATNATDIVISNWSGSSFEERLRITSDGKFGIGTDLTATQTDAILTAEGSAALTNLDQTLMIIDSNTDDAVGNGGFIGLGGFVGNVPRTLAGIRGLKSSNGSSFNGDLAFYTRQHAVANLDEKVRITFEGKVLIGSNTGSVHGNRLLQIGKTDRTETYVSIVSSTSGESGLLFADTTTNDTGGYRGQIRYHHSDDSMNFRTGASERVRITSVGLVGIGTDNPGSLLTLDHATNPAIQFKDSGTKVASINSEGTQTNIASFESKDLVFATSSSSAFTERLRITSTGYVGINETTPTNRLHVKETNTNTIVGRIESSGAYSYLSLEDSSTTTGHVRVGAHGNDLVLRAGNGNHLRVTSAGDLLVNHTDSDGSGKLQVFTNSQDGIDILGFSSGATAGGRLTFYRSKSAGVGNFSEVADGDSLGRIDWRGYNDDGTANNLGATIEALVSGAVNSTTDMPSDLVFKTSPDGGASPSERLRIASDGKISITGSTANMEYLRMGGNNDRGLRFTSSSGSSSVGVVHTINAPGDNGAQGEIVLQTNSTERIRIKSDGVIQLSNIASAYTSGNATRFSLYYDTNNHYGLHVGGSFDLNYNAGGTVLSGKGEHRFHTGGAERVRINESGTLIVDAGGEAQDIQIISHSAASGHGKIYLRGNASNESSSIQLNHFGHADYHVSAGRAGNGLFSITRTNGGHDGLIIKSDGNVGVNTTNPTESLFVNGTTRLGGPYDYGSTTILSVAPGVVKWDTPGQSGGRLNADAGGNWYLNNKSYPIFDSNGVSMNDIYGANSGANNVGQWVLLGNTQGGAPYPRKVYKISGPNSNSGTFVYQVWYNGDANYAHGGLYEIRINNWSESSRFTSVTVTCINGDSDGLRIYAYNNTNGIWITTNAIWGSLYIRKFGYDDSRRSRGVTLCAVDKGSALDEADVNGTSGAIPSGYTEVHASDSGGGGYNIETNTRFGAGGN